MRHTTLLMIILLASPGLAALGTTTWQGNMAVSVTLDSGICCTDCIIFVGLNLEYGCDIEHGQTRALLVTEIGDPTLHIAQLGYHGNGEYAFGIPNPKVDSEYIVFSPGCDVTLYPGKISAVIHTIAHASTDHAGHDDYSVSGHTDDSAHLGDVVLNGDILVATMTSKASAQLTLELYDLRGRKVANTQAMENGIIKLNLGRSGANLPSSVYLYAVKSNNGRTLLRGKVAIIK